LGREKHRGKYETRLIGDQARRDGSALTTE